MSDNQIEGGDRALLGFYYQMVVTIGIGSLTLEDAKENHGDGEQNRLMTALMDGTHLKTLFPEQFGQDIYVSSGNLRLLLQAKHSSKPTERDFAPAELRDILISFSASHIATLEAGLPPYDWFGIVTNRKLSSTLPSHRNLIEEALKHASVADSGGIHVSTDISRWSDMDVELGKFSGPLNQWLKHFLTKPRENKPDEVPTDKLVNAAIYIYPRLLIYPEAPLAAWRSDLHAFARKFGARDAEIEIAESRLIGQLMQKSGLPHSIQREDIVEALTGYRSALNLTPKEMGAACAADWRSYTTENFTRTPWMIRRRIVRLEEAVATQKIVFLFGGGGCGKSVVLTQLTEAPALATEAIGDGFDGYVALESCHDLQEHWLEKKVGSWAKRGAYESEHLDAPIERIHIALPSKRRLIWIALDGLDEHFPKDAQLKKLIRMAKSCNEVCIIFSCRDGSRSHVLRLLYRIATGGHHDVGNDPDIAEVSVPDFGDDEVFDALSLALGPDILVKLHYQLNGDAHRSLPVTTPSLTDRIPSRVFDGPIVDNFLLTSLRHPRMLGAFVDAVKTGVSELPQQILSGDKQALRLVARKFLYRFLAKYDDRREEMGLPPVHEFIELLQLAGQILGVQSQFDRSAWRNMAKQLHFVSPSQTSTLLQEAVSGGLIDADGDLGRYFWRHLFVAECLAEDDSEAYWNV